MTTRTYANPNWLAGLSKLTTKGLTMKYLQQQAELNYLIAIYKDLKMQSLQQEALLARANTIGKEKALDGFGRYHSY